jgi:hypothetical protein
MGLGLTVMYIACGQNNLWSLLILYNIFRHLQALTRYTELSPLFFSRYSLTLKWIQLFFPLINLHTIPHNDETIHGNITFTYVFRPFTQYFVEAPLASITASSLLEYYATSLAHLYLGSFSYSSLQIL